MEVEHFYNNSIFWVEVEKVRPNPFQPRKEFSEGKLEELADSIRQYGVLQPLVVTRHEIAKDDGGLAIEYELIAGERRLRASRLAGLSQVPVIIRTNEETDKVKLELAIIENLQREDLNAIDRAQAFKQLVDKFGLKHGEVGKKVGKSREYVSNSIRLLTMPEEIQQALLEGKMSEGHARPILMLTGKDEEQHTLFKEILYKKLTVREAESIARRIAQDRVRKKEYAIDPELIALERQLTETLGTRVQIEQREGGGKVHIDYFTVADLRGILEKIEGEFGHVTEEGPEGKKEGDFLDKLLSFNTQESSPQTSLSEEAKMEEEDTVMDDRSSEEKEKNENDEDLYSVKNFSI
ncbi:MAG: ParB/RepB/Spo0J family partition protein [Candidatus Paceibacterota bacterium]